MAIRKRPTVFSFGLVLIVAGLATDGSALDWGRPTLGLYGGGGMTTYKSKLVDSNDTSFSYAYAVQLNAGEGQYFGAFYRSEANTTSFTYASTTASSKIASTFDDYGFRLLLGPVHIQVILDTITLAVTKEDVEFLDALASGIGFGGGIFLPLNKMSKFFLGYNYYLPATFKDSIQGTTEVKLASRSEMEVGGILKLTKRALELEIGYRQSAFNISVAGTGYDEEKTSTWLALIYNLRF